MQQLRFQQYGGRSTHKSVPLIDAKDLLRYFSSVELQPRIRVGFDLISNLRRAVTASQANLLGFAMFYDETVDLDKPQYLFRYYIGRFQIQKKESMLSLVDTTCNVLNYLRMAILQAKKAMDSYTGDELEEAVVVRSLIEVEIESNRLEELYQEQLPLRGFSRTVHYKFEQTREDEITVFVGFCDRSQQFVHLLLNFREHNLRRLKVQPYGINLYNLDSVVEHLIVVMRRIAGEKDFNLFDNGIRAVLETYVWPGIEQTRFARSELVSRFRQNQRLLLLYECNYAYLHMHNTSSRNDVKKMFEDPHSLYRYLFDVLMTSQGLLLRNQDISYCSSSYLRQNGQLVTIIGCEKKNSGMLAYWPLETFVSTVTERLSAYFQRNFMEKSKESSEFNESIRSNVQLLGSSRALVKSRLEVQGDYLVAVPINIRLQHQHFTRQFDRLLKVLDRRLFSSEQVEQLIDAICKSHRRKMEKVHSSSPKNKRARLSGSTNEHILRMCIAKTLRFLTANPEAAAQVIESTKERSHLVLPLLVRHNPYANDSAHFKIIRLLAAKSLRRSYDMFIKTGGMDYTRNQLLYQYLSAVFENRQVVLDISEVGLEEEVVGLLSADQINKHSHYYGSLLEKLSPVIWRPLSHEDSLDAILINTIFKYLEDELRVHSTQQSIYAFLGGLYFETVYGPQLSKSEGSPVKLSNSAYRNKTVSQLTATIKRNKVLELIRARGLKAQIFAIHNFFGLLGSTTQMFGGIPYQVYRDFQFANYPLRLLLKEVARTTTSIDMIPISKCIAGLEEDLDGLLEDQQGQLVYTFFDEDIENFILPEPTPEQLNYSLSGSAKLSKDLQLNKSTFYLNLAFEESRIVRQLFNADPNARLVGVEIRDLFTDRSAGPSAGWDASLYDRPFVVQKILGLSLTQADQLLTVYESLRTKALSFSEMGEQEKSYFNEQVNKLLLQQSKLKRCMIIVRELEGYLRWLDKHTQ